MLACSCSSAAGSGASCAVTLSLSAAWKAAASRMRGTDGFALYHVLLCQRATVTTSLRHLNVRMPLHAAAARGRALERAAGAEQSGKSKWKCLWDVVKLAHQTHHLIMSACLGAELIRETTPRCNAQVSIATVEQQGAGASSTQRTGRKQWGARR